MTDPVRYAELHAHSYFSLLDGASAPEALVEQASRLGLAALALTDHNSLAGAVRAWTAAKRVGLHLVLGAEVTLADGSHLTLLAENQAGYRNLCQLISAARLDQIVPGAPWPGKVAAALAWPRLAEHKEGLIALSGCRRGPVASALLADQPQAAKTALRNLLDIFGTDQLFIEVQHHWRADDKWLIGALQRLATRHQLPIVATGNAHYAQQPDSRLRDALLAIDANTTLTEARRAGLLPRTNDYYLRTAVDMQRRFPELPQALHNSVVIAERCQATLDFAGQRFPAFPVPDGSSEFSYLFHLTQAGIRQRYPNLYPAVVSQLAHELRIIDQAGLGSFFLLLLSLTNFARERRIWFQIRGSLAGSLTAYALGISPIDPLQHGLLFERFLSEDRYTAPDADFDFDASRREEIIQHLYQFYGQDHVAMVANVVTYQARSALRDLGKVLGFPEPVLARLAQGLDTHSPTAAAAQILAHMPPVMAAEAQAAEDLLPASAPATHPLQQLAELMGAIDGCPRHLSIHSGGMLITAEPLTHLVPLEPATMVQRIICQWNKTDVEDVGLVKLDVLGLRMLGVLSATVASIETLEGHTPVYDDAGLDDANIYRMLQQGDAVGTFQTESRAQLQMAPRLKPTCFDDLVVQIAIVRPGPIQAGATNPYLRRRAGAEAVTYLHPSLAPILRETLGVILFQEQAIRIGATVAGFTPGQADLLRRTLARSHPAEMAALQVRFLAGAATQGFDAGTALAIWRMLSQFAGYGFPKSHVVAFALTAYRSAKLRYYYPAHFYCQLLNHQPLGFYSAEVVLADARRHGVAVLPPAIHQSSWPYTLERREDNRLALRIGLRAVKALGEQGWQRIAAARQAQPFTSLADFCQRTRLPKAVTSSLIRAGAFDALGERRQLLWALGGIPEQPDGLGLPEPVVAYEPPVLEPEQQTRWDYQVLGYSPHTQLLAHYRARLRAAGVLSTWAVKAARAGQRVRCAGMVAVLQRPPTANGITFLALEDESGLVDGVVKPHVYDRFGELLRHELLLVVTGIVQQAGGATSLLIDEVRGIEDVVG